jgi:hypothetical protein
MPNILLEPLNTVTMEDEPHLQRTETTTEAQMQAAAVVRYSQSVPNIPTHLNPPAGCTETQGYSPVHPLGEYDDPGSRGVEICHAPLFVDVSYKIRRGVIMLGRLTHFVQISAK